MGQFITENQVAQAKRMRLPANAIPKHYDVTIEVDFDRFTFEGTTIIDLVIAEHTTSISLHTFELDIISTSIYVDGALAVESPSLSYEIDTQITTIDLGTNSISKDENAQVELVYTGQLNDKMAGLYRSQRKDGALLAVTQFEPTDARRALPCFDEPALKAEFTVTLIADEDKTCLSNMDIACINTIDSTITKGKRKAVKFNRSPRMSTYILAFVIAELKSISVDTFRLPITLWVTPEENLEHGRFALDVAAKTLTLYEDLFQTPYPLPKIDMVAIPDFAAGAMENWGLVTYRMVEIFVDQQLTSNTTRERVAEVVQHEMAHQWFGDLVTMSFWDGLWLNEGFANWMSWYSSDKLFPDWKVWETFVVDNLQRALDLDSLRSSHPIEVPIYSAQDIHQTFDAITYSKASAVLRMISKTLGEKEFLEGIRRYINTHAWNNAEQNDLWSALSSASGMNVGEIIDPWTKNVGYPVISVTENSWDSSITIIQDRFLLTGDLHQQDDNALFPIILGLKTRNGVSRNLIMTQRIQTFTVDGGIDFYKLNCDHSGFYRTYYTPHRLTTLSGQSALLSVEDRAGLIADAGALAVGGYGKTSELFNLLESFSNDVQYVVWKEIVNRITVVREAWMFEDQKVQDALKAFQLELCSLKAHHLGWDISHGDHILGQFQSLMFSAAGAAGDGIILKAAKEMFGAIMSGDATVHPNLRAPVLALVLRHGGMQEWNAIIRRYQSSRTPDDRDSCLRSLGQTENVILIDETLALALGGQIKMQDVFIPLSGLGATPKGVERRWDWMCNNWDKLVEELPPSMTLLNNVVGICVSGLSNEQHVANVETFFRNKNQKGFELTLRQGIDRIKARANWVRRDREDVYAWLEYNGYLEEGA